MQAYARIKENQALVIECNLFLLYDIYDSALVIGTTLWDLMYMSFDITSEATDISSNLINAFITWECT